MEIKHSIIMICYNQEQYVRQALDSVLCEQVKPYEIIIGDDFSTDGTRSILQEYKEQYPEIIKLILNEKNLGIFANLNNVTSNVRGDLISLLAGDDWFKSGLLENMNKKIVELNLDPRSSRFMLLPNMILHQPDGTESVLRNNFKLLRKYSPVGLVLRKALHTTNAGLSRAFFDLWPKYPVDSNEIGPWVDFSHHIAHMQHCDKLIIMDCEGPVYRAGVGIASRTDGIELAHSFQRALFRIQSHSSQGKLKLDELDAKYLEFLIAEAAASIDFSLITIAQLFQSAWRVIKIDSSEIRIVTKELLMAFRRILGQFRRNHFNLKSEP